MDLGRLKMQLDDAMLFQPLKERCQQRLLTVRQSGELTLGPRASVAVPLGQGAKKGPDSSE